MEHVDEIVAAHRATLEQMNMRLGSIEATMREIQTQMQTGFRDLQTQMHTGFQAQHSRFATVSRGERCFAPTLRAWVGVLAALILASGLLNWLKG